jgi:hypothetical protein
VTLTERKRRGEDDAGDEKRDGRVKVERPATLAAAQVIRSSSCGAEEELDSIGTRRHTHNQMTRPAEMTPMLPRLHM